MSSTIVFTADTTKNFVPNTRRGMFYSATIQNLTDQSITFTVTNQDVQGSTPVYDTPAAGALTIAAGAIGTMGASYNGWLLTAGLAATGTVEITEGG